MNHFTHSLLDYLKTLIHPILKDPNTHELRIFLSSFPPAVVHQVGRELSEYWLKSKRNIDFKFKVGNKLWRQWDGSASSDPEIRQFMEQIQEADWVDQENRLTYFRNLKWNSGEGKDGLVVMLIGVEQATDQGSLEDFYFVDAGAVWNDQMKRRFKGWLVRFLHEKQIDPETSHLEQMEELLEILRRYGAGDLLRVSEYLDTVDFSGVLDSHDALCALYGNLSFWGLPVLSELSGRNWKGHVQAAIEFFSYQKYLKETARKNAVEKVEQFREREDKEDIVLNFGSVFEDEDDLLECLTTYLENNNAEAKRRLLKFNFKVIKDDILDYKTPNPIIDPPIGDEDDPASKAMKTITGPPLEAILTALWQVMAVFKNNCSNKKHQCEPGEVLKGIHLKGLKFIDFEADNIELARGLLGGIDDFLTKGLGALTLKTSEGNKEVPFHSQLLDPDTLPCTGTKSATPNFQFEILFTAEPRRMGVRQKFKWMISETHPFRNLWAMAREVLGHFNTRDGFWLPVFHIPYYSEMFLAPDEVEVNRVLQNGLKKMEVSNLLQDGGDIDKMDLVKMGIPDLSNAYGAFLKSLVQKGYFSAIECEWLTGAKLSKTYESIMEKLIKEDAEFSEYGTLMYKAFLLTEKPSPDRKTNFPWEPFVSSAVVTGLHPALIEMLHHRETFLRHAWIERATFFLNDTSGLKVGLQNWQDICDLGTINYPLFGILSNSDKKLDTRTASFGHVHLLGKPEFKGSTLSSKILQRYEVPDEDDITDASLFRETRESRVISRILDEYTRIYPHAEDGISLAVLNATNIQAIIAGVDGFLHQKLKKERIEDVAFYPPYHFSLLLFMNVTESGEISRWLNEWQKRWDPAHGTSRYEYYQNCRLSVSQKVVASHEDYLDVFSRNGAEIDIAVLSRFMDVESPGNDLVEAPKYIRDWDMPLKFPILEVPRCQDKRQSYRNLRSRVISNRRFRFAALHSELSVRFRNLNVPPDQEHIVISQGDYTPWARIIDLMHRRATWVLCLDPSVDERLIGQGSDGQTETDKREIIGFCSGVGSHGELNYTISTERSSLLDVQKVIQKKINNLFGPWENEDVEQAARLLVREARNLSGLSLVRATGKGEKIRDLIGYALVRNCLPKTESPETLLCDELVVLDAFPHWFENMVGEKGMYPDLLRIEAFIGEDNIVSVKAHLFECKISIQVKRHLEKARAQLENGLQHLMFRFLPRDGVEYPKKGMFSKWFGDWGLSLNDLNPVSLLDWFQTSKKTMPHDQLYRFDQRYWWAQLQRLIANKAVVDTKNLKNATAALENLGDGQFRIFWNAAAVTVWTESNQGMGGEFRQDHQWIFQQNGCQLAIPVISCGGELIRRLSTQGASVILPVDEQRSCGAAPLKVATDEEEAEKEKVKPETASVETVEHESSLSDNGDAVDDESEKPVSPSTPHETETPSEPATPEIEQRERIIEQKENKIPDRVFLGMTDAGREIFWEFGHSELTNRHILIFGKSGVGKTYAIQALLYELGLSGQNSAIIDYTNGFLPPHLETLFKDALNPETHLVRQKPLPMNPFRKQEQVIEGFDPIPEDSTTVGGRVTSVINSVYSNVGEQQRAVLVQTISDGLDSYGEALTFHQLLEMLKGQGNTGLSLANKISPLVNMNLFAQDGRGNWESLFNNSSTRVSILQLAGVPRDIARIATEFILWDLYDYANNSGSKDRPLPMVLDEIQNLDHRLEAPLGKFLTEGRKFGLALILATQTLSNLRPDERDRLFQASHKLFFKPAETEVKEYARILEQGGAQKADTWISRLNKLNKGECYSMGPALNPATEALENKAFKIKITAFADRAARKAVDE